MEHVTLALPTFETECGDKITNFVSSTELFTVYFSDFLNLTMNDTILALLYQSL